MISAMATCNTAVVNIDDDPDIKQWINEKWFVAIKSMVNLGYIGIQEMKELAKKRKSLEKANAQETKESLLNLIHFEIDLYHFIELKSNELDFGKGRRNHIKMKQAYRVMNIFRRILCLYKDDTFLWFACLRFCRRIEFTDMFSRLLSGFVNVDNQVAEHWVFAAHCEKEHNKAEDVAGQYLDRGIKALPKNRLLHTAKFNLELIKFKKAQMLTPNVESKVINDIKDGSVLKRVYTTASKECADVEFKAQFYVMARSVFCYNKLFDDIITDMVKNHLDQEVTWDLVAHHAIFTSTIPKQIMIMIEEQQEGQEELPQAPSVRVSFSPTRDGAAVVPPPVPLQVSSCSRCHGGPASLDLTRRVCRCVAQSKPSLREVGIPGTLVNRLSGQDRTPTELKSTTPSKFAGVVVSPKLEKMLSFVAYNCPMELCDSIVGAVLTGTERVKCAYNTYQLALKRFKNQRIWDYYVDFLKKLLVFARVPLDFRNTMVRQGFLACYEAGFATPDTYKFWFEHADIMGSDKSQMIKIMRDVTTQNPDNADYWSARVKYLANNDMKESVREVLEEAMGALMDRPLNEKLMIVQTVMCYLKNKKEMYGFWENLMGYGSELDDHLKPCYIKWLGLNYGIEATRKLLNTPQLQSWITAAMLHKMAELELLQPERNLTAARRCHELAVTRFGAGNTDVWISYICFEVLYGEDQRIQSLYGRAAAALGHDQLNDLWRRMDGVAGMP